MTTILEFIAELAGAKTLLEHRVTEELDRVAERVENDARALAAQHAPIYSESITRDPAHREDGVIVTEVGPDSSLPEGDIGNLMEYGSVNNPPYHDLNTATDGALDGLDERLADIAAGVL